MEGVGIGAVLGIVLMGILELSGVVLVVPEDDAMRSMIQQDQQTVIDNVSYKCEAVTEW